MILPDQTSNLGKKKVVVFFIVVQALLSVLISSYIYLTITKKNTVIMAKAADGYNHSKPTLTPPGNNRLNTSSKGLPELTPTSVASPSPTVLMNKTTQTHSSPIKKITNKKVRVGITIDDHTNSNGELSNLEKQLEYNFSTLSIYKQFGLEGNKRFSPGNLEYAKTHNKKVLVAWEPWNPGEGMKQSHDYLTEIINGMHDGYIRDFAQEIKSYNNPVIIRFGHEMNGNWYPWSGRPTEYVNAYRYIVTMFRNEGVHNVTWMWCVNVWPLDTLSSYYPGEDVVDYIGIDGYNFGTTKDYGGWKSFKEIFTPSYIYIITRYNKPIIIAEISSAEPGGDKASWIRNMFADLPGYFPAIQEIIWFHYNKEMDWRINSSDSSLRVFQEYL